MDACSTCGAHNSAGAHFCSSCGSSLQSSVLTLEKPTPTAPAPPSPKKSGFVRRHPLITLLIVVIVGGSIGAGVSGSKSTSTKSSNSPDTNAFSATSSTDSSSADNSAAPVPAAIYTPRPSDFALRVKTLSKDCFGSAGCNITYRIDVTYTGADLDPDSTYEVTYKVTGDEDGPQINTFTITDGTTSHVDAEEIASTSSSRATLKATITEVDVQ